MKKYILLLAVMLTAFSMQGVKAQSKLVSRYKLPLDTITNTGVKNMTVPLRVASSAPTVTVSSANIQLTGTMSGVVRLFGSLDGVKYQRVTSASLKGAQVDSALISVNKPNYAWVIDNNPFYYYQVQVTGVGTSTFTTAGYIKQ